MPDRIDSCANEPPSIPASPPTPQPIEFQLFGQIFHLPLRVIVTLYTR